MASLSAAQCPRTSHCNASKLLNWFCTDCDELLCDDCMKVHIKAKTSNCHNLININDNYIPQEDHESQQPQQRPAPCQYHMKDYSNYCVQCHKLVCPECLVTRHNKHELEVVDKIHHDKIKELEQFEITIEEDLIPAISRNIEYLESANEWYIKRLENERKKIDEQDNTFKQKITDLTNKLLAQLMQDFDKKTGDIAREKDKLEKTLLELKEKLSSLKRLKTEDSLQDLIRKYPQHTINYVKECDTAIKCIQEVKTFYSGSGEVIEKLIDEAFGSLRTSESEPTISFEVVESVTLGTKVITEESSLAVEENGTIWIGTKNGLMKKESYKEMEKIYGAEGGIVDIACTKSGELLFAQTNENALIKVLDNGKKMRTIDNCLEKNAATRLSVVAVHVGPDGKIFLLYTLERRSVAEGIMGYFWNSSANKCNLQVLSPRKKFIKTITIPVYIDNKIANVRIAENVNGHFCVIDPKLKQVIDIDSEGKLMWTHNTLVRPNDVVTTNIGNVIVSVDTFFCLQILNSEGKHLHSTTLGIPQSPVKSLCFRNDKKLVCLCKDSTVLVLQVK